MSLKIGSIKSKNLLFRALRDSRKNPIMASSTLITLSIMLTTLSGFLAQANVAAKSAVIWIVRVR